MEPSWILYTAITVFANDLGGGNVVTVNPPQPGYKTDVECERAAALYRKSHLHEDKHDAFIEARRVQSADCLPGPGAPVATLPTLQFEARDPW